MNFGVIELFTLGIAAGAFFSGLIRYIWNYFQNKKNKNNKKYNYFSEDIPKDLQLRDLLTELRVKTDAARTMIGRFHNGGNFFDGSPMKKYSLTHETTTSGISHEIHNYRDVLTSMFVDKLSLISSNDPKVIKTDDLEDGFLKSVMRKQIVKSFCLCPLYKGEILIGFIEIHWCSIKHTPNTENKARNVEKLVAEYAEQIAYEILRDPAFRITEDK
jgi:transcriptional regulator with GAF, ATPase, and Fis domain